MSLLCPARLRPSSPRARTQQKSSGKEQPNKVKVPGALELICYIIKTKQNERQVVYDRRQIFPGKESLPKASTWHLGWTEAKTGVHACLSAMVEKADPELVRPDREMSS